MEAPRVGEQELALLQHLAEHGPASVGQVAERFGAPRELARTTVLTMMERLRRKRQLERRKVDGVFHYRLRLPARTFLRNLVERFVDGTLGGSVSPFVAYLAEREEVSERELAELEHLVATLRARREEER
jgi:predicted transcriptional regulator